MVVCDVADVLKVKVGLECTSPSVPRPEWLPNESGWLEPSTASSLDGAVDGSGSTCRSDRWPAPTVPSTGFRPVGTEKGT